jgi:hypothetical protein
MGAYSAVGVHQMAQRVVRVVIASEDMGTRELFSVLEKPNGELVIPFGVGGTFFVGDTPKQILEHRYSIHFSPKSTDFITLKQTVRLEDDYLTSVSLTDAIKTKSGFSPIYVRRCRYPVSDVRDKKYKSTDTVVTLPPIPDHTRLTLFNGLFIGHPDVEFTARLPKDIGGIHPMRFRKFQLIFVLSFGFFGSYYLDEFLHYVTLPPEMIEHPKGQEILRLLMKGRTPGESIEEYQTAVGFLSKRYLTNVLPWLVDERAKEQVTAQIAAIENVDLSGTTPETQPDLIRMLISPRKPPSV